MEVLGDIVDWHRAKRGVFVYFNNDIGGYALENALTLKRLLNGEDHISMV